MNVIDPREVDAMEWFDSTIDLLSSIIPPMILRDHEREWREWGYHVRQTLSIRGILTPDPDAFPDWRDWAFRFNQIIAQVRF